MNTKRLLIMLALVIGTLYASDAHAQACTISATSVNFGTYNVFNGSDVDSTGTVTYRCNGSCPQHHRRTDPRRERDVQSAAKCRRAPKR
jgi:hypothetical protein